MDIGEVRRLLTDTLRVIPSVAVFADAPGGNLTTPAAFFGMAKLTYDTAASRGLDTLELPCYVIVGSWGSKILNAQIDPLISGSGPLSVKAAIEADRTLGGAVSNVRVTGAEDRVVVIGANQFLAYRFAVTVRGRGE